MAKKITKIKISKVKQKNILGGKKTKGKKTGSKAVVKARRKLVAIQKLRDKNRILRAQGKLPEHGDAGVEDVLDMLDDEELSFVRSADAIKNQYFVTNTNGKDRKVRKRKQIESDDIEDSYETKYAKESENKQSIRVLLPIKTKGGLEMQVSYENGSVREDTSKTQLVIDSFNEIENDEIPDLRQPTDKGTVPSVISTAMLLARRKQKLAEYKLKIGILSASFLEDPDNRLRNLDSLLAMLETNESAVSSTVPKMAAISLVMVFQDVLPAYPIKHHNREGLKLKKDTRELQGGEANLLKRYKIFLQKLEKMVGRFLPRKKPKGQTSLGLGLLALDCMCKMLVSHPYFNLATNIVNFVIPFLNHWELGVRTKVSESIRSIFRIDKRGQISYEIVRRVNMLVKSKLTGGKSGLIRRDVIDIFLSLRIKEVDLEKEKTEEMIPKGKMTFEQRRMLSKRQRKKAKDMVLLERELLEVAAEENKAKKSHFLTEITKIVFTIYFRTLKSTPDSKLLSAVLEGLAKFAHIINIDFFDDLLKVLGTLQKNRDLKPREIILCIATVLGVLDGQGQALTLDPTIFHGNLYTQLMQLKSGKSESDVGLALRCIRLACGNKKIPGPRAMAFLKRLAIITLQLEHHDALACLIELRNILKVHPASASLLDTDGTIASGVYQYETNDPNHCDAHTSTLWEMTTLASHYHPWVVELSKGIVTTGRVDAVPKELFMKSPEEVTKIYNPYRSEEFQPELKPPMKTVAKNLKKCIGFVPKTEFVKQLLSTSPGNNCRTHITTADISCINFI